MNPDTGHIFDGEELNKLFGKLESPEVRAMGDIVRELTDRENEIYQNIDKMKPFENGEVVSIKDCYFRIVSINVNNGQILLQGIPKP